MDDQRKFSLQSQYELLHKQNPKYGVSSERLYPHINPLVKRLNPNSIIDYGCGRSRLLDRLVAPEKVRYDFAIPEYSVLPTDKKFDLCICTDVLEHIPESELNTVITNLKQLSDNHIVTIALTEAFHKLPNGMNCHVTVKPKQYWMELLPGLHEVKKKKEFSPKFLFLTSIL